VKEGLAKFCFEATDLVADGRLGDQHADRARVNCRSSATATK
jgi:hypothetical protein